MAQELLEVGAVKGGDKFSALCRPVGRIGLAEARAGWGKRGSRLTYRGRTVKSEPEAGALARFRAFLLGSVRWDSHLWLASSCGSRRQVDLLLARMSLHGLDLSLPCASVSFTDSLLLAHSLRFLPPDLRGGLTKTCRLNGVRPPSSGAREWQRAKAAGEVMREAVSSEEGEEDEESFAQLVRRFEVAWTGEGFKQE